MTVQLIILDYCLFYDGTDIMVFCKSKTQTLSSFEKPVVVVVLFFFFSSKIFFLFVVL